MQTNKILSTNKLATSPHFPEIIAEYTRLFKETAGKVNEKKFYEEVILPRIPDYKLMSLYQFLRRFKDENGIVVLSELSAAAPSPLAPGAESTPAGAAVTELKKVMLSNQQATAAFVQSALNISADAAANILANPHLLSEKEKVLLGIKIMKAQDSRIHAIGKIREDNREQEKFDRAFDQAAYG